MRVEVEVRGDESVKHIIDGATVLEYTKPQIGGGNVAPVDPAVKVDGTPMTGGYISIQAETAPTEFRKIEVLNLEGLHGSEVAEATRPTSSRPTRTAAGNEGTQDRRRRRGGPDRTSSITQRRDLQPDCLQRFRGKLFVRHSTSSVHLSCHASRPRTRARQSLDQSLHDPCDP